MKRLIIFWGKHDDPDYINVTLERKDDDYVVFAYGDEIDINLFVGDDTERYDLTFSEAIRRKIRQLNEDDLDSEEEHDGEEDISDD